MLASLKILHSTMSTVNRKFPALSLKSFNNTQKKLIKIVTMLLFKRTLDHILRRDSFVCHIILEFYCVNCMQNWFYTVRLFAQKKSFKNHRQSVSQRPKCVLRIISWIIFHTRHWDYDFIVIVILCLNFKVEFKRRAHTYTRSHTQFHSSAHC